MLQKNNNILVNKASYEIAKLVFNYPHKKFYLRELAREIGCSTTAISDSLNDLKIKGIIKIEKNNLTKNIIANLDSEDYRYYKLAFNLYRLASLGITKELIKTFKNPECITIFGSFAKAEDIEESDIDLLIITDNKIIDTNQITKTIEKEFNRKLNLHIRKSYQKFGEEFINSVCNSMVLYGYLKVK